MHSSGGEIDRASSPKRRLPLDQIPQTINGYRVDGVLGQGGTGIVLRVHDEALDRFMALKLLADELDDDARARFMIEARAAGRIIHPNVVQVYAVGSFEGRTFITQELVEGHALSSLLEVRGQLSAGAVADIGVQAARGLQRAAEVGVVHRDVKPHNLLVTDEGLVKLADFGLAKLLHAPSPLTDSGTTVGTPHYMSPEQGLAQELDARSDQYSLGATLYHLVAGRAPFDADNAVALLLKHVQEPLVAVRSIVPDCPEKLASAIERMLAKKKEERFDSFEEVIVALELALEELPDPDHEEDEREDGASSMRAEVIALVGETASRLTPIPPIDPTDTIETIEEDVPAAVTAALAKKNEAAPAPTSRVREAALFLSLVGIALAVVIVAGFNQEQRRSHAVPAPALPVLPVVEHKEAIPVEVPKEEAEPARSPFERPSPEKPIEKPPEKVPVIAVVKTAENATIRSSRYDRLVTMLDDARTIERAARELGELGDQRATPSLIRVLEGSGTAKARAAAAEALGRLGDTRAIGPLQAAADLAKPDIVREAAREAQKRLFHVVDEEP